MEVSFAENCNRKLGSKDDVGQSDHLICHASQGTLPKEGDATGVIKWLLWVVGMGRGRIWGKYLLMSIMCLLSLKQFLIYDLPILNPLVIRLF